MISIEQILFTTSTLRFFVFFEYSIVHVHLLFWPFPPLEISWGTIMTDLLFVWHRTYYERKNAQI